MKRFTYLLIFSFVVHTVSAQLGINNPNPHPSALLDLAAPDKGILLPQVDLQTATFPPPGPAVSLLVYNTNNAYSGGRGYYYNSGTEASPVWTKLVTNGADNLGNHTATQNILLNNQWLSNDGGNEGIRVDNAGNVGIGTTPTTTLDVGGTGGFKLPVGTTAQRPASPATGTMRFNTTSSRVEVYDGAKWRAIGWRSVVASGGTITDVNGYRIHTFTSSSTFNVIYGGNVEVLVVAGGGGGTGSPWGGGGGGGGGVIYHATYPVTDGASIPVTVGAGGAQGSPGGHSFFGPMQAFGGGASTTSQDATTRAGGSGGGAGHMSPSGAASPSIQTSNNGGTGYGNSGGGSTYCCNYPSGSGGGAGGGGCIGCAGGSGRAFSISGTSTFYAGGGGEADNVGNATAGGAGGGGAACGACSASNGTPNTGGGGGGSRAGNGGAGGSGVVIVRYQITE